MNFPQPDLPALDAVREALGCSECGGVGTCPQGYQSPDPPCPRCRGYRWTYPDPQEALEVLVTRGHLPADFVGDKKRLWRCEPCEGSGYVHAALALGGDRCRYCRGRGYREHPPTVGQLVQWAGLGTPTILGCEELARQTLRDLRAAVPNANLPRTDCVTWRMGGPEPRRVPWFVGPRESLCLLTLNGVLELDGREQRTAACLLWERGVPLVGVDYGALELWLREPEGQ